MRETNATASSLLRISRLDPKFPTRNDINLIHARFESHCATTKYLCTYSIRTSIAPKHVPECDLLQPNSPSTTTLSNPSAPRYISPTNIERKFEQFIHFFLAREVAYI